MMGRAFLGAKRVPKRSFVFSMRDRMDERYDLVSTARSDGFRYIRNYMPQIILGQHVAYEWQSAAYQAWEKAHLAGQLNGILSRFWESKPAEELYDVNADPHEVVNLVTDPKHHAQLVAMRRALDQYILSINDNGFIPEGDTAEGFEASRVPDNYPAQARVGNRESSY